MAGPHADAARQKTTTDEASEAPPGASGEDHATGGGDAAGADAPAGDDGETRAAFEADAGAVGPPEDDDPAAELAAARAEIERLEDRFLRARADYDNLIKRTAREQEEARRAAAARVIEAVLAPLEVLERAATDLQQGDDTRVAGLNMAIRQLRQAMEREGLEAVPGVGAPFDHGVHEAIAREDADAPAGTILEVVRSGYRLNGRLLRPALVKVSAGPAAPAEG